MKREFLDRTVTIDPILFHLFVDFFQVYALFGDLPTLRDLMN